MAHIDCIIDTHPMADEIKTVSTHITGTTAAVVGMKAAIIAAENSAAEHVCENVNKGFYTLIHSQISQKIAKLQSEVDSHLMKLNQLRKQLLGVKGRMEHDYGMISQRYLKLFNGLNKNLRQRVFELDRPTTDFAVKDVNALSNRTKMLTATVPIAQLESLSMSQKIIASNMKYRGMRVIDSMTNFLADMNKQREITEQILLSSRRNNNDASLMIPIIISETEADKYGNKCVDVYVSGLKLQTRTKEYIRNAIHTETMNLEWEEGSVNNDIKSAFSTLLSNSSASQRVKDTAHKLFTAHNYQTIKM